MGIDIGLVVEDNDMIGKVSGYDEIVFDDEGSFFGVYDEFFDDMRGYNMLFGIEIYCYL